MRGLELQKLRVLKIGTSRMILICLDYVRIILLKDVCQRWRCWINWRHVILLLLKDIMYVIAHPKKFCKVGTTGPPFTLMLMSLLERVINVNKKYWSSRDSYVNYARGRIIWHMGNWFYGPVCEFFFHKYILVAVDYASKLVEWSYWQIMK